MTLLTCNAVPDHARLWLQHLSGFMLSRLCFAAVLLPLVMVSVAEMAAVQVRAFWEWSSFLDLFLQRRFLVTLQ